MKKHTEQSSSHRHLEHMPVRQLLEAINQEDGTVPDAVARVIPILEKLVLAISDKMQLGGRLFYLGAGTSGRLGILDASECPPTFGVDHDRVIGLIAGGDTAIRKAVEFAEDDTQQAWLDLAAFAINDRDVVIGIAASGTTPYVVHGLKDCQQKGILTACITCNQLTPLAQHADFPLEVIVGPEFVTGSTRMKAGTAQKLVLNMISTSVMIQLGYVKDNKMWNMQLSNDKLWERGIRMLMLEKSVNAEEAKALLRKYGSVRAVLESE